MLLTEIAPFLIPITIKPGKSQSISSIDIARSPPPPETEEDYEEYTDRPGLTGKRKIDSSILWFEGEKADAIYFLVQGMIGWIFFLSKCVIT